MIGFPEAHAKQVAEMAEGGYLGPERPAHSDRGRGVFRGMART